MVVRKNKAEEFLEIIEENDIDFGFICETWLHFEKNDVTALVKDKGYILRHSFRKDREGGGVGVIVKDNIRNKQIPCKPYTSFEHVMVSIKTNGVSLVLATLYRLQEVSITSFFSEFTEYLGALSVLPDDFVLSGDINFHLESSDVIRLNELFDSFNLVQYVDVPTHKKGHTLDFIVTRCQSPLVSDIQVNQIIGLSDHFFIGFDVMCEKASPVFKTYSFRNTKSIDVDKFKNDIVTTMSNSSGNTFGEKISYYNENMSSILDNHAPLKSKTIKVVPKAPWFDGEYVDLRRKRRKAEKKYRKTHDEVDKSAFLKLRKQTTELAFTKKRQYFTDQIKDCSSSKALYGCVNRLLDNTSSIVLPSHDSPVDLASSFNSFFKKKIEDIRKTFPAVSSTYSDSEFSGVFLDVFRPATLEEVQTIVSKFGLKCSPEDPIPSKLLPCILDVLLPIWLELINLSLEQGSIECLKSAVIFPLLKGLDSLLDPEIFKNYRPVSTLQLIGKLIERIVADRLDEHMDANGLHCVNQHGYKRCHSTETLLLKIANDLFLACDKMIPTLLMLLDLSAAFDTVDHEKMLSILKNRFGIRGTALNWFRSFLVGRSQRVKINDSFSNSECVDYGVPQGSILGPKLFNMYAQSFASVMGSCIKVSVEGYADDHQIQKQFNVLFQFQFLSTGINNIFNVAEKWMLEYFLMINSTKTLIMIVAPPSVQERIHIKGTFVGDHCIRFVSEAKNLGFILDSIMCFNTQVKKVIKGCYASLRKLSRIKRFLSRDELLLLTVTLVFSQMDYCNSLYYRLHSDTLHMLQVVQNNAARLVAKVNRFDGISTEMLLKQFHWLRVKERIEYKLITIVFKCLHGLAPVDLSSSIVQSKSERTYKLNVPSFNCRYGERSFSVAGPRLWNDLPLCIRSTSNLVNFKKLLKTHLFKKCYNLYESSK